MEAKPVDLQKARQVFEICIEDQNTATFITGSLMLGVALKVLHDLGRSHEEILDSVENTLNEFEKLTG